ncbi:DUF885 domain-containing protein [Rhodoferax sp.]|uniref:DUF885 domain-containing protein n=1 Tax=Rhodoferax sp. TaxID=50421 RepID=UPI002779256A|nr:DUF885 domain-containing protein [Rhodoferax sp.]
MSVPMSWPQALRATLLAAGLAASCNMAVLAQSKPPETSPMNTLQTQPSSSLRALFAAEWERSLQDSPETASYMGDTRFDDRWTDFNLVAITAREAADREALVRLRAIGRSALSESDKLDYDIFEWQLQHAIERQQFREYLQPIGHQGGVQTADGIAEVMPFGSVADYRKWLARLQALPTLVDQTIALLREGVKHGSVPPRVLMERAATQIAAQVVADPAKSPFYRPFLRFDAAIAVAEREQLLIAAQSVIKSAVVPAYARLQTYFNTEYLPKTRSSTAVSDAPNGRAYYDFLARYYTSTGLSADQVHAIGVKEVARLRVAMEAVKQRTGFTGSLPEFFVHLRTDPKFFHTTPQALLAAYRATAKRIDPELVKVFKVLPRQPYGVRAIPDNIAPDTTTAYYQPGATDGSRAGNYYVNLYKPETRPTWEMVPLTLHEAVPGHHFQFARAQEMADAPMFRKTAYFVAYGEGWALYAEQLGFDMGLYDDPYDHFGQLTYEMWRAVRLVVDTGLHAKGWSRERAIAYFKEHAAKTDQDIVNEIDRYIGTPAQALAYKIGQLKISELRLRAQHALGRGFDLRDFNDAILATGSVPLSTLESHMDAWIARRK